MKKFIIILINELNEFLDYFYNIVFNLRLCTRCADERASQRVSAGKPFSFLIYPNVIQLDQSLHVILLKPHMRVRRSISLMVYFGMKTERASVWKHGYTMKWPASYFTYIKTNKGQTRVIEILCLIEMFLAEFEFEFEIFLRFKLSRLSMDYDENESLLCETQNGGVSETWICWPGFLTVRGLRF